VSLNLLKKHFTVQDPLGENQAESVGPLLGPSASLQLTPVAE